MSTTLTYGHKLPDQGDKGSSWFPDLESNIALDDSHTHNGTNSAKISSGNIAKTTQSISSANWVAVGDGTGRYRQVITFPSGVLYDDTLFSFADSSGNRYFLNVEKITDSTYYVYINDNSLDLTAYYS